MKKYIKVGLVQAANILELFIAGILALGVLFFTTQLVGSLFQIGNFEAFHNAEELLAGAFTLLIGIELIHMLCEHSPGTVFQVLLFAIARQIVIDHEHAIDNLIGVAAIAILFATRKYLFCHFDESESIIFRASQKVTVVNKIIHTQIPYHDDETLGDVLLRKFEDDQIHLAVGACACFSNFTLRVAKMHDGKVSRIEVIRSIR